jgi:hypothetical protein
MPALVAGIHVLLRKPNEDVDGRDKPGHDVESASPFYGFAASSGMIAP